MFALIYLSPFVVILLLVLLFDDDIETSYDGSFEFDYLEEGTYRLFVYEKCTTCNSGKAVIMQTIEIDKKKSAIDVGTINVRV